MILGGKTLNFSNSSVNMTKLPAEVMTFSLALSAFSANKQMLAC